MMMVSAENNQVRGLGCWTLFVEPNQMDGGAQVDPAQVDTT